MAPRKPVSEELSRSQILDAARELFIEKGYESVSMRQLARKLGYSHGAIYYHFKDKADLFSTLVAKDFHSLNLKLEVLVGSSYQLQDILLGFIEFGLNHPHHYELMFMTGKEFLDRSSAAMNSYEKFALHVARSAAEPLAPKTIWSLFIALHGFVSHYLHTDQTFEDVEELARSYTSMLLKGIS